MFLVIFNEINYYEVSIGIFIKLKKCRNKKKNKFVRNFEYEKLKFLS